MMPIGFPMFIAIMIPVMIVILLLRLFVISVFLRILCWGCSVSPSCSFCVFSSDPEAAFFRFADCRPDCPASLLPYRALFHYFPASLLPFLHQELSFHQPPAYLCPAARFDQRLFRYLLICFIAVGLLFRLFSSVFFSFLLM